MVLGQAIHHFFQGHNAGRGDHAGLAHGPAQPLAHAVGPVDEGAAAAEQRSHRRAQALRDAEHERIHVPGVFLHVHAAGDGRVEDARPVHVQLQAVLLGDGEQGRHLVRRPRRPAAVVVGVLDAHQAEPGKVGIGRTDEFLQLFGPDDPVLSPHRAHGQAGYIGEGPTLPVVHVGQLLDDHLVSHMGVGQQRTGIAHGPGGHVERRFHPHSGRGQLLQLVHGGIVPVAVVPQHGPVHGLLHLLGRQSEGIAPQIHVSLWHDLFSLV